jgi:hypothetical protein
MANVTETLRTEMFGRAQSANNQTHVAGIELEIADSYPRTRCGRCLILRHVSKRRGHVKLSRRAAG